MAKAKAKKNEWRRIPKMTPKRLEKLKIICDDLHYKGMGQLGGAIWYFQNNAEIKGFNSGYAAKSWVKKVLQDLDKLFPDYE